MWHRASFFFFIHRISLQSDFNLFFNFSPVFMDLVMGGVSGWCSCQTGVMEDQTSSLHRWSFRSPSPFWREPEGSLFFHRLVSFIGVQLLKGWTASHPSVFIAPPLPQSFIFPRLQPIITCFSIPECGRRKRRFQGLTYHSCQLETPSSHFLPRLSAFQSFPACLEVHRKSGRGNDSLSAANRSTQSWHVKFRLWKCSADTDVSLPPNASW